MTIQRITRGNQTRRTLFEAHAESDAERTRREGAGMTTRRGSDFEAMVRDERASGGTKSHAPRRVGKHHTKGEAQSAVQRISSGGDGGL